MRIQRGDRGSGPPPWKISSYMGLAIGPPPLEKVGPPPPPPPPPPPLEKVGPPLAP